MKWPGAGQATHNDRASQRRVERRRARRRDASRPAGYASQMAFTRITSDPAKMAGVPCIRGLRFPVATVVAMVADGMTNEEILAEHPDLEAEDISEALRYAALAVQERQLPLLPA